MEALRADIKGQVQTKEAESVDLIAGDHAFRKNVVSLERQLEVFANKALGIVTRSLRQACPIQKVPADVVGPRAANGLLNELFMVAQLNNEEDEQMGFVGLEGPLSFLLVERAFGAPPSSEEDAAIFLPERQVLTEIERIQLHHLY